MLARRLRQETTMSLKWIAHRLQMGTYDPIYTEYFERRRCFAWRTLPRERTGQMVLAGV
jgi:hypothetical protein